MADSVVSGSTLRRRACRDVDRRLQQMRENCRFNFAFGNRNGERMEEGDLRNEERVEQNDFENGSEVENEDVGNEGIYIDNTADIFVCPQSADFSEDESDLDLHSDENLEEPCSLSDSICNWALTFGISLVALTALLGLLRLYHPELPKDARTLLNTKSGYSIQNKVGGYYYYFGILASISKILSDTISSVTEGFTLKLQINVDGLPLFKSTSIQLWPILGLLLNLPMKMPVVIGLFCGPNKPKSSEEFMKDFVTELRELENVFSFNGKLLFLKVDSVVCDTPARAFLKNTKAHNGYHGCDKCAQRGQYVNNRMTFPLTEYTLRTDESFSQKLDEEHHLFGLHAFQGTSIGMVSQFPVDYMHLVCLGVVRKLLNIWLRGPLNFRLPANIITRLSDRLNDLRPCIPVEFARKPRTLREIDRWKATEFRLLLLYTGPVVLCSFLDNRMYNNFMLLFSAISILVSPVLSSFYCQYAQTLLQTFVNHFGEIYGKDQLVYNVHCLVHLSLDVQRHGSLDCFSSFLYENHLQRLKKLVRKPERPLAQIVRRLTEQTACTPTGLVSKSLEKPHYIGPVPDGLFLLGQYRQMRCEQWVIKVSTADNVFIIGDDVCMIYNIVESSEDVYVVYKVLLKKSVFFTYPFKSDFLNIYCISQISETIKYANVSAISQKCIVLPHRGGSVAIPLLHSQKY